MARSRRGLLGKHLPGHGVDVCPATEGGQVTATNVAVRPRLGRSANHRAGPATGAPRVRDRRALPKTRRRSRLTETPGAGHRSRIDLSGKLPPRVRKVVEGRIRLAGLAWVRATVQVVPLHP